MGLSIKDAETERLVRELAIESDAGVTGAIRLAVAAELARRRDERAAARTRKLAAIRDMQQWVEDRGGLPSMKAIDADIYDENGLPR